MPAHSVAGDSTDYDTETDEKMRQVLAEMPPLTTLPLAPSLPQPPAAGSGAGLQTPPPPPTTSGALLMRKALHTTPPASDVEQAVRPKQPLLPSVQAVLDTHVRLQKEDEEKKWKAAKKKKRADERKKRQLAEAE